jgi:hypothetical protein
MRDAGKAKARYYRSARNLGDISICCLESLASAQARKGSADSDPRVKSILIGRSRPLNAVNRSCHLMVPEWPPPPSREQRLRLSEQDQGA